MNSSRPFRSARSFPARRDRGSAFITAVMFMLIASLLIASVFEWSSAERRINIYNAYYVEARHAAEAIAEYGAYQVQSNFNNYSTPLSLDPAGNSALTIPSTVYSFFSGQGPFGSQINTRAYDASSNPYGMQVIGSYGTGNSTIATNITTSGSGLYYVNPNDPDNANDTLKGQYTTRRDVQILAKATVMPPIGAPITAYVTQTVSVRGSPLFANAIFYSNNDLEASPGPDFDIYGPVHVNGNIFVSAQGTVETGTANYVAFHGPVSITGNIYHAWANTNPSADGRGYSSSTSNMNGEPLGQNPVTFVNAAGSQINLQGSNGTWNDSTMGGLSSLINSSGLYTNTGTPALTQLTSTLDSSDFRTYATQTWSSNLQTSSMGVQSYNPISFSEPIDSTGDLPDPHSIINPPASSAYLADSTDSGNYSIARDAVETQKFSTQSGLYVLVTVTPGVNGAADTAAINLYGPSSTSGNSTTGPNGGTLIASIPAGTATSGQIATFIPYQATASGTTTTPVNSNTYSVTSTTSNNITSYYITTSATAGTSSQPVTATYNGTSSTPAITNNGSATVTATKGAKAASTTGTTPYTSSTLAKTAINSLPSSTATGNSTTAISTTGNVASGLYDPRQQAGVNLVQIDMSALKTALANTGGNSTLNQQVIADWNGGVYVDVESTAGTFPGQTSVITANAQVASGSSMLPTVNNVSGIMLATNAPMYVLGNFNADGTISTGTTTNSAIYPDDGKTDAPGTATSAEVPSALAADSITILSSNYFGNTGTNGASATKTTGSGGNATISYSNSSSSSAYSSYSSSEPTAASSVEIAAAFITGIVTTSNSTYSGGVNNLPRFIENWNGNSVAIRGSLTSLYSSEVATGPWAQRYYSAPKRVWGFDAIFSNGTFPPITPKVISFRRAAFTTITSTTPAYQSSATTGYSAAAANYNAQVNALWPGTNPSN